MTTTTTRLDGYQSVTPADAGLPIGLRWDTPRRHAGQMVEIQYAEPGSAAPADDGAPFARVIDYSIGPQAITYYVRA